MASRDARRGAIAEMAQSPLGSSPPKVPLRPTEEDIDGFRRRILESTEISRAHGKHNQAAAMAAAWCGRLATFGRRRP